MATRNIVPRATGEGQIGTSAKTWSAGYFNDIAVTNGVTASTFTGDLTGDVTGDLTGNVTGDVTGDVTGTASGNLALSGGTMTGAISFDATGQIGYKATTHLSPSDPCKQLIISSTDIDHWGDEGGAKLALHTYDDTQTNTSEDGAFSLVATDGANGKELKGQPNGTLIWGGENVLTSSFITTVSVTITGSVSANNWADYEGNITYPAGYSHALCIRNFMLPSPANMSLIDFDVNDTKVRIRLYSKTAYTNQSFNVAIAVTK